MKDIIIGISPDTRLLGYSLFAYHTPIDAGVRIFKDKWTAGKLRCIVSSIKRMCEKYEVKVLAIRIPQPQKSSKHLDMVTKAIIDLAKKKRIKVLKYDRQAIGKITLEKKWTNDILMQKVAGKFPEYLKEYEKELEYDRPYYLRMFEALALGCLAGSGK